MSKKSFFSRKAKAPPVPPLRTTKDIKAEYDAVCGQVGEAEFHKRAREGQVNQLTQRLYQLHQEFTAAEAREKPSTPQQDDTPQVTP